jgi:hypothetical protein
MDWSRTGTELSPKTAGDSVFTSGSVKVGGTTAAPNLQLKADGGIVANTDGLVYDAATKRLGLGTSSPSTLLDLSSSTNADQTIQSTGARANALTYYKNSAAVSSGFYVGFNADEEAMLWQSENNVIRFGTNNIERVRINASGNVGIGTQTPQGLVDITATGDSVLSITSSGVRRYQLIAKSDASLSFYDATGVAERARIDSSGRLLVGTSTDSGGALLQVNGDRVRIATAKTPASATAAGVAGEICWDASYVYVCVAANTWKRSAIATW